MRCARRRRMRTFQFSYRGWSIISERIYIRSCVNFFILLLYIVLKSVNSARCVCVCVCVWCRVYYAYTYIKGKNSPRDADALRHRDDGDIPENRERE